MVTQNPDVWAVSVVGLAHDPALARVGNFLASGPKRGIIPAGPNASGAVRAMATPTNKGLVAPFVGVAPNPLPNHFGEVYAARSREAMEFTLTAAPSSGPRTDAIISRIYDPGIFGVQPPGNKLLTCEVIQDVDPGMSSANALALDKGLNYPFIWHANVTLPANENVVTGPRITDRRYQIGGEVFKQEHIRVGDVGTQVLNSKDGTNGVIFPSVGGQHMIYIPDHISQIKVTFEWLDLEYLGTANTYGDRFVRIGTGANAIDTHRYHFDAPTGTARHTFNWKIVDVIDIPVEMRGTTQRFEARAYLGSSAATDQVRIRTASSTILSVEFRETLN